MRTVYVTTSNPMFPGTGLCDPHLRALGDTAWLYLTHDDAPDNTAFTMKDWRVLSSTDLVHWQHACTIRPEQTYLGKGYASCWAVDAAHVDGKTYLYFSEKNQRTGVLIGDSPAGPWHDPIGGPLVSKADLSGAEHNPYDPGVFIEDDGTPYLVVGVWDFYLIRLNRDMISFAEPPVRLTVCDPEGPYGKGKTDDKPFLFKRAGLYYLSWGCFYGVSETLHGPYQCKGSFITEEFTDPALRYTHDDLVHDRHGSFFSWQNQWYFICNDMSQTRTRKFRDCCMMPIDFRENGDIEPARLTLDGIPAWRDVPPAGPNGASS